MTKIVDEYVNNNHKKSSVYLLKVRLWFYSLLYVFMAVVGFILLRIDFTAAKDPLVRLYHNNRWLLITTWFNLISLVYTPICIYCDWRALRRTSDAKHVRILNKIRFVCFSSILFPSTTLISLVYTPICIYCDWRALRRTSDAKHVRILNKIRFVCFSSILFPSTTFSDILFWKLWLKNRDLVAPASVDVLVPLCLQHCLHTVTLFAIILDLLLVPRRRPKNLTLGVMVLSTFLAAYAVACGRSIINNEHIYPLLRLFSGYRFIPLVIFVSVEHFFYYTMQWLIVDLMWGQKTPTHALMALLFSPSRWHELVESSRATTDRKSRKDTLRSQKYTKKVKSM